MNSKERIHIISFEPISEKLISKSIRELGYEINVYRFDLRATTRELYDIV